MTPRVAGWILRRVLRTLAPQERVHRLLQLRRELDDGEMVSLLDLSAGVEHCCRAAFQIHQILRVELGCPSLLLPTSFVGRHRQRQG